MVLYEIKGTVYGLLDGQEEQALEKIEDGQEQAPDSMFEKTGYLKFNKSTKLATVVDEFTRDVFGDSMRIDISSFHREKFRFIAVANFDALQKFPIREHAGELLKQLGFDGKVDEVGELTRRGYRRLLEKANRDGFCSDDGQIVTDFKLHDTSRNFNYIERRFSMFPVEGEKSLDTIVEELCVDGLKEEIDRIMANPKYGTPVHYIIKMEDIFSCKDVYNILLPVMYKYGRIKRQLVNVWGTDYTHDIFVEASSPSSEDLQKVYDLSECGVAIIRSHFEEQTGNYQSANYQIIKHVADVIKANKKNVITILCIEKQAVNQLKAWKDNLEDMTFVEITEKTIFKTDAEKYLFALADKDNCVHIDGLFEMIEEKRGYTRTDLDRLFATWYANYQKTVLFPEYKSLAVCEKKIDHEVEGIAYSKLEKMIGLDEAKEQIQEIINFAKLQKIVKDKGIEQAEVCKHMVFTGNPGTAKTTVARYFAQIMKDNDLLSVGRFVEAGRGDLVGAYIGHTALRVKEKFKEAKGGVLFIDEAYSLVDDRKGSFGDEAINTIVQEMENRRDDTIVIFAGYKKEMESFINRNSGLKSRIAHYIDFPDYNEDELSRILNLMADEQKLVLTGNKKITSIMRTALKCENFGNGRFARNLLDKARLKLANRVARLPNPTIDDITTLLDEDFELPVEYSKQKIAIGF